LEGDSSESDGDHVPDGIDENPEKLPPANKLKKRWGERYQLTLVSPSVVPNFLPTVRVVHYNISGLENHPMWKAESRPAAVGDAYEAERLELRNVLTTDTKDDDKDELGGGKKKQKKKKKKKTKDPNLVVPPPPAKASPPGPAYSPQPLTLTRYVQYFANLTFINNDIKADDIPANGAGWDSGKHRGKSPQYDSAKPLEFEYQVEYDTAEDAMYKLPDLTVNSMAELAYRLGQKTATDEVVPEDEVGADGKKRREEEEEKKNKKKKNKKNKKKKEEKEKHNKVWIHFLDHAFVKTLSRDELEKLDG